MQNGHATAIASAPVASSSSVRSTLMRFPSRSSMNMRPPPAPQHRPRSFVRVGSTRFDHGKRAPERLARRIVHVVVAAEIAGVVVRHGELLAVAVSQRNAVSCEQPLDVRRVVDDLVVAAELRDTRCRSGGSSAGSS